MEDGRITVIASTTENPYFYVYNAVLSRSTVFEFKQVPAAEVEKAVLRAVSILSARENVTADIEPGTAGYIASVCGGDVRKALNAVELLFRRRRERGIPSASCARMPRTSRSAAPCTMTVRATTTMTSCQRS